MKMKSAKGLFDIDFRQTRLTDMNDPLVKLNEIVKWENFRPVIDKAFPVVDFSKGGRPPYDRVMLFKILILKKFYGLSDDGIEYQITDRLSFMRFLGLELSHTVPDAKTVWLFGETLTNKGVLDSLFIALDQRLHQIGLVLNEGKIVDAQIVKAPIQRNTREENERIKSGELPGEWSAQKQSQKDTDARWTEKHGKKYFGYKNHIKMDSRSKLITNFETSPANNHDSLFLEDLIEDRDKGQSLHADAAYESVKHRKFLKKKGMHNYTHKKARQGRPLTTKQKQANHIKSRVRARVEHAFGAMTMQIKDIRVRCRGLKRATAQITLTNICYNLMRSVYLVRTNKLSLQI